MQELKEKINGLKKQLFATGFFHVFGSNVVNQMVAFLSGILLVRILTKSEYGVYSYAYNIVSFFLIFNGLGVTSALLQTCSEERSERLQEGFYGYANQIGMAFDLVLGIVLAIVAAVVPFKLQQAGQVLCFMCLLPMGMLIYQIKSTYLRAILRTRDFSYANTINSVLIALFSISGALLFREEGLVTGQTLAYFLSAGIVTIVYKLSLSFRTDALSRNMKKDFLKISVISAATIGLSQLMGILDVFVLGMLIPDEKMIASYKVATTIPLAIIFIPNAIITYVYPYFARNKDNRRWLEEHFRQLLLAVGALNAVITSFLIVLSPFIIRLVFGRQYLDAVVPFCILSINYFFTGTFNNISGNLLVTQRRLKFNFWRGVVVGVFNLFGNIMLIPLLGPTGAAVSTLCAGVAGGLAATWKMRQVIRKVAQPDVKNM